MHLCYWTRLGSTGRDLRNRQQPMFVMAAVLVSDEKWQKTERAVVERVGHGFGGEVPEDFELQE